MIVVDTNLIAYLWLPNEFSAIAEKILAKDSHWVSVPLWRSEFRSVATVFLRKKLISYEETIETIFNAEEQMLNSEYTVSSIQVMRKVHESTCSAYDCEYVALADALHCPLITNDKKILKHFPNIAIKLSDFV